MHSYTVVDGLVGPIVPVIFQDSRGDLWFGSESGGVSRFDGESFEQFRFEGNLSIGITRQILEDKWGHVWFLTRLPTEQEGTVGYFNGTTIETVGTGACLTLDSNGDIWAATNQKLIHYVATHRETSMERHVHSNGKTIKSRHYRLPEMTDATINVLFQSSDKTFWAGGSIAGGVLLLNFDPDSDPQFKRIGANSLRDATNEITETVKDAPVFAAPDGNFAIHDITQGPYGTDDLWFAGPSLLLRFDGKAVHQIRPMPRSINQTNTPPAIPNDSQLHHDPFHGCIWFSEDGDTTRYNPYAVKKSDGLLLEATRMAFTGGGVTTHYESDELVKVSGTLKMQDMQGNLWFAMNIGVFQYDTNRREQTYTVENGLSSDNIQTIFQSVDGSIWFGHDNGVTVFKPQSTFVNFKTRHLLGSNRTRQIYEDEIRNILWFSIPGGIAYYKDGRLYQQKLGPGQPEVLELDSERGEDRFESIEKSDGESVEIRRPLNPIPKRSQAEVVGIFQSRDWVWFINRAEQTSTGTLYTFFARGPWPKFQHRPKFQQLSIQIQTEGNQGRPPQILISGGSKNPCLAFGGWLFKPYSEGLKWVSPHGTQDFPFQSAQQSEDFPMIEHGPSTIIDVHTNKYGHIWCYLENGTVQSYANLNREKVPKVVLPKIITTAKVKPLRLPNPKVGSDVFPENAAPKWFFNSEEKQIIYWDTEILTEPTVVEGVFNAPPLAIWESADAAETTFIFSDRLRKYRGTQLIHEEKVSVAEVRSALLTNANPHVLWLATKQGAVRYDGTTLKTYGIEDGFLVNDLRDVLEDDRGHIWFATWGGGGVRYDGETFTPVTTRDGLAHNSISDIHQSRDGVIWFATEGGITRYTPTDGALPFCNITAVKADETYTDIPDTDFTFPSRVSDITFHFEGINPLRLRHHLTYEFKLLGVGENAWTRGSTQTPTRLLQDTVTQTFATSTPANTDTPTPRDAPSVTYQGLKPGNYTFLVKTYRKGWPYTSTPAAVNFTIATPFWAQWRNYLPYLVLIGLLITIVPYLLARLVMNRRRVAQLSFEIQQKEEAEMQQLRAELDEARNMQTALLPTKVPEVEGLDVAGISLPATQVGGDFYDYFNAGENHLAIAVADAAGKGLRGALNAVLTNGMLNEIVQIQHSADVILTNLNTSLAPRLYGRTFIALNLAIIDPESKQMLYANAGQPYPILKRGDTFIEIEASELPLGGMKRTQYAQERLELAPGDIYIFYTDGVIEALNSEEEMYGTERLKSVLA
ncbi:SpoIIE family protein phosphatase, partial [Candidatus Poribacteria bacterium]|nr:SpoIIE family protein phosphatase [Candidatus Poribacteria bacterium]